MSKQAGTGALRARIRREARTSATKQTKTTTIATAAAVPYATTDGLTKIAEIAMRPLKTSTKIGSTARMKIAIAVEMTTTMGALATMAMTKDAIATDATAAMTGASKEGGCPSS